MDQDFSFDDSFRSQMGKSK